VWNPRGGRWLPAIDKGQWWRWGTSIVLHENHDHIMSNMALFMVLSYFMEQKYGTMRVTLIAFIAGVGGNFFRSAPPPL
jgi:rhomboid protease GluP